MTQTADLEAQIERLQEEADRARELLRGVGVPAFSSLSEGVRSLCQVVSAPVELEMELTDDEVAMAHARWRAMAARLRSDETFGEKVALRLEALRMLTAMLAARLHLDAAGFGAAFEDVERKLKAHLLRYQRERNTA